VIDLMEALRASLSGKAKGKPAAAPAPAVKATQPEAAVKDRKGARRSPKPEEAAAPVRVRAKK
jgi:hypothetical protein